MAGAREQASVLGRQGPHREVVRRRQAVGDGHREIQFVLQQFVQQALPAFHFDVHTQARMLARDAHQQQRQEPSRRKHAYAQVHTAGVMPADQLGLAAQVAGFSEDTLRAFQHGAPGLRGHNACRRAVDQHQAQGILQGLDAAGQRGLREVQTLRRAREVLFLREHGEVLERPNREAHAFFSSRFSQICI
ncbi:hypothetical protein FQZ97_595110 [compost metagenome]